MDSSGTTPQDYDSRYYETYAGGNYHVESAEWRGFFGGVADNLIRLFDPEQVLDAGCAKGLLVEAFVERGVDAAGIDISSHAIANAPERIRGRLSVGSMTAPIESRYDLITCIEVLEHMAPKEAEIAIENITNSTDLVVFSSTPRDFDDATHVNVQQPASWAARFAGRGFFRRFDVDLQFLSPWAVAFERRPMTPRDVVFAYETLQWPLQDEVSEKRMALLEKERLLGIETERARGFDELVAEGDRRQAVIDELVAEGDRRQAEIDAVTEDRDTLWAERDALRTELTAIRLKIDRLPAWVRRWVSGMFGSEGAGSDAGQTDGSADRSGE